MDEECDANEPVSWVHGLRDHIHDHLLSSREVSMSTTLHTPSPFHATSIATRLCTHRRLIDEVLTPAGLRTGQVRCLECCAVFDDPALEQEE